MGKLVKDIMNPIEEYDTIDVEAELCDALAILKRNYEKAKSGGSYHKTLFVTDASKKIMGKLSMYNLTRGLVPENAQESELHLARRLSSRAIEAADQAGEILEHYQWLHTSFVDLIKQVAHKKVKDIMAPTRAVLQEDDKMNHAIFVLFKEGVRQQLVERDGKVVGVINLMVVLTELLEAAGPECHVNWE
jgi:CBS-domain-containing membrane protein